MKSLKNFEAAAQKICGDKHRPIGIQDCQITTEIVRVISTTQRYIKNISLVLLLVKKQCILNYITVQFLKI